MRSPTTISPPTVLTTPLKPLLGNKQLKILITSRIILAYFFLSCLLLTPFLFHDNSQTKSILSNLHALPYSHFHKSHLRSYIGLLTHTLVHSSPLHFFQNSKLILLLSPSIEAKQGPRWMLFFYIATTVICGVFHALTSPKNTSLCGGSSLVFMLIGMHAAMDLGGGEKRDAIVETVYTHNYSSYWPQQQQRQKQQDKDSQAIPLTFLLTITAFSAEEIIHAWFTEDNVSRATHLVGGIVGVILMVGKNRLDYESDAKLRKADVKGVSKFWSSWGGEKQA